MKHYLALTKPRITLMILICTGVGYSFGTNATSLLHALLGTALMASGTAALNQWYESDGDALMRRTRHRPIPAGQVTRGRALAFGILVSIAGFAELWAGTNPLAAGLGLFTLLSYLLIYTPMKRRTPISTTVGAIPGAMPPLIGYAAATGGLDAVAWILFGILFVWQFPHFYAIAWLYRDDYRRGGIRMLPVVEPDGESTARRIVTCSVLLLAVSLLPQALGIAGLLYTLAALAAGAPMCLIAVHCHRSRTPTSARHVLLASVGYLPLLLTMMVLDRQV